MGSTGSVSGAGSTAQWTEMNLTPNTSYQRYVVAVNQGVESDSSNSVTRYTLANPPTNLVRSTATTSSITLVWNDNNNASGTRYILRRATYPTVTYVDLSTVTATTYIDSNVLQESVTYTYQLHAMNGEDVVSSTITLSTQTAIVKPASITSLSALAGSLEGEVFLSWIAPGDDGTTGNITGGEYDIRWSTDNITSDADFNLIPETTTYQKKFSTNTVVGSDQGILLTGLTFGTTIYFAMKTQDEVAGNFSDLSTVIAAQLNLSAPSSFAVVSATTETITWQWTDNSSAESGFRIYASTGGIMGSTGSVSGAGSTVQWTEINLTPGTSYQRYVAAFDQVTESAASNSVTRYTLANPPTNLVSSTATISSISLVWNANNNASGVRYILRRATYPTVTFADISTVTATTFIDTGLAEYTTYTYQLHAMNGEDVDSSTITFTTATTIVQPGSITSLSASAGVVEDEVFLNWIAPGDDDTTGNIVGGEYDIRWSTNAIASDADFNLIPETTTYQKKFSTNAVVGSGQGILLTGLTFNTTVYFAMKTRDEISTPANYSELSNSSTAQLKINVPSSFVGVSVTTETITWQWTDTSLIETGFRIYSSTGGIMGSTGSASGSGSTAQWTETSLTLNTSYQRYVVAFVGATESDPSNSASTYTLANPPSNLVNSTATTSSITLAWNANNNSSGTRYILEQGTSASGPFTQIADITTTTFVDTSLAEFTTYTYRLKARNGEGIDSSTITFTTTPTMFPVVPSSPGAIQLKNTSPSTDPAEADRLAMLPGCTMVVAVVNVIVDESTSSPFIACN